MDFKPVSAKKFGFASKKMTQAIGRSTRSAGPFPCSDCKTQCMTRRNRRRHVKLRHREQRIMIIPSIDEQKCSSDSKAAMSRSAAAKQKRAADKEAKKEETTEHQAKSANNGLRRVSLKLFALRQDIAFRAYHVNMYEKKELCDDDPCTEATAQGTRKIPQRLLVRERRAFLNCSICGEEFRQNGALRSHMTSEHNTKYSLAEAERNMRMGG